MEVRPVGANFEEFTCAVEECLDEAEKYGADRHEVADALEALAEQVRNGYTQIPEHRGRWWHEVHGDQEETDAE